MNRNTSVVLLKSDSTGAHTDEHSLQTLFGNVQEALAKYDKMPGKHVQNMTSNYQNRYRTNPVQNDEVEIKWGTWIRQKETTG